MKLSENIVLHVVQLIPGFLFKSFNGAPSAAKNSPQKAKISLPRIVNVYGFKTIRNVSFLAKFGPFLALAGAVHQLK